MVRNLRRLLLPCALLSTISALGIGATGCIPQGDITIRNPLVVNTVEQNSIVKPRAYVENARGLPPGSLADIASLTRLGGKDVCFEVTLHELDAIDLHQVRVKLDAPGLQPREQAQLWPEQPVTKDYAGLVPNRVQTGYETFCSARDGYNNCISWATRPTYTIVMESGNVQVFETRGRMCFPNDGFITATTPVVRLELVVPRPAKTYEGSYTPFGIWGMAGDKRTVFSWALEGASPTGDSRGHGSRK